MYTHTIHNGLILKNVRVEIVHENNPVFADEDVSAILRFRHLGQPSRQREEAHELVNQTNEAQTTEQEENLDPKNSTEGWFGKRLSMQLTNTARSLFLEQLDNEEQQQQKVDPKDQPVDLISGYIQLSGFFTYDTDAIEQDKVDIFRKKAAISGKIGGLEGLEVSKNEGNGFFKLIGNFSKILNSENGDLKIDDHRERINTDNLVPFFSTSQSLLFSNIHLEAGEVKTFYFRCKLPKELPPSYSGNSISITYHTIIGASLDEKFPKPLNVHFPLRVSTFFDKNGYQTVSNLDQFILLPSNKIFNDAITKSSERRRSSFRTIKSVVSSNQELSHTEKQKRFLSKMDELISGGVETNIPPIEDFITPPIRDVITTYCETSLAHQHVDENEPKSIIVDHYKYEKQIRKFQTQYLISKNKNVISMLTFSKPLYKIGDIIRLSLDFTNHDIKTTGVLITLENLELIRDLYSTDPEQSKNNPRSVVHFRESFSTYNLENLSVSIAIPLSATSQFKTNIFESRWCLSVRFIITKDEYLEDIHKDNAGQFLFAKEHISGEDFKIKLPVIVLPSDQDFGGIPI